MKAVENLSDLQMNNDDSFSVDEIGSTHIDSDFKLSPVSSVFGCSDESQEPATSGQARESEKHSLMKHSYFLRSKRGVE